MTAGRVLCVTDASRMQNPVTKAYTVSTSGGTGRDPDISGTRLRNHLTVRGRKGVRLPTKKKLRTLCFAI